MATSNDLKQKTDDHLLSEMKSLVSREREILTQILNYLKEIEARRLYLARGYSSLFAFMTDFLGYSESAAQRRIQAMRLIKDVPEVETKLAKGDISLSVASQMQSFFKATPLPRSEKLNLIEKLQGTSARECEQKIAEIAPETVLPRERTRPITEEKTLIQFTANKSLMKKLNRLKSLLSHQLPESSFENLFDQLTEIALNKLDPERRDSRRQSRTQRCTAPLPTSAVPRVIARSEATQQSQAAVKPTVSSPVNQTIQK